MEVIVFFVLFFALKVIDYRMKNAGSSLPKNRTMQFGKLKQAISSAASKLKAKPKSAPSETPAVQYPPELVATPDWSVYDTPAWRRI